MLDSTRLAKFIKDAGVSFRQNSKSFIFTCPLCNGKEKLYIRKSDGKFACWKCKETQGFQGSPEFALAELTSQPINVVKKSLYGHLSEQATVFIDVKFNELADDGEIIEESELDLPRLTFPYDFLKIDHKGAIKGLNYLNSRNIGLQTAIKYDIRFSPEKQAVIFPIYIHDALVGWQFRTIEALKIVSGNGTIINRNKAWSSENIPSDKVFMFQNNLLGSQHAVLCEGPIDAIVANEAVGGGIASMGKAVSAAKAGLLCRSGIKTLYVAIDPDAFMELRPLLSKFNDSIEILKVDIPNIGEKPDMGSLSNNINAARNCILNAKPLRRNDLNVWLKGLPSRKKTDRMADNDR
jgi:hypothetical protein